MTQDTIDKLHDLEFKLHDAERDLRWLEEWGEELHRPDANPDKPDTFRLTIMREKRDVVFVRPCTRKEAEAEYEARHDYYTLQIELIKKEIADL